MKDGIETNEGPPSLNAALGSTSPSCFFLPTSQVPGRPLPKEESCVLWDRLPAAKNPLPGKPRRVVSLLRFYDHPSLLSSLPNKA